jgi:hypothetical protein
MILRMLDFAGIGLDFSIRGLGTGGFGVSRKLTEVGHNGNSNPRRNEGEMLASESLKVVSLSYSMLEF